MSGIPPVLSTIHPSTMLHLGHDWCNCCTYCYEWWRSKGVYLKTTRTIKVDYTKMDCHRIAIVPLTTAILTAIVKLPSIVPRPDWLWFHHNCSGMKWIIWNTFFMSYRLTSISSKFGFYILFPESLNLIIKASICMKHNNFCEIGAFVRWSPTEYVFNIYSIRFHIHHEYQPEHR